MASNNTGGLKNSRNYAVVNPQGQNRVVAYTPNYPNSYDQQVILVTPTPAYGYYDEFGYYEPYPYYDDSRYTRGCILTTIILLIFFFIIIPGIVLGVYYGGGYHRHRVYYHYYK